MRRDGFTLIELVVVLVLMAALSLLTVISFSSYKGVKVEAAAQKIAMDIKYVRYLALSTSKWYGISFEADPINTYTVYETDGSIDTAIEDPAHPGRDFLVDLNEYYEGVLITGANFGGGTKVEFHPLGTPHTDSLGPAIATPGSVALESLGITREVYVAPNTGRVTTP